ncbi:TOG array regulator of axonemal microtubules protein 1 isoform X2 [Pseudorasbora parva]|uniref:TOG array regulator of axonemal microtubules protein 1 isoform X2 n=1 Tax=Pseudorasbora parva TaxID=51549 RepID=UPI00351F728F
MMIYGLIPPELHQLLLDQQNFQNRTRGVEELKSILAELDLQQVSSGSVVDFIQFLRRLLDDSNFKVLCGALQLLNLLTDRLERDVERYYREIAAAAVRAMGDSRNVPRREYMSLFRKLMRAVGPRLVLEPVLAQLRNRNSRVREDAVNIITAALLTHPRKDFDIAELCAEAAPPLADAKRKVRLAALELFAVFDSCLDPGKKQPILRAVDRVERTAGALGLMEAVQARRARHILPRLMADGTVEYALALPKPGQRRLPQMGSGADLDWVMNGGRASSADADPIEDQPHRRIASAGKGKNKLPWERSALTANGRSPDQVCSEDPRLRQDTGVKYSPPEALQSPGRTHRALGRLRRSGSLDSDPDIFKTASEPEKGLKSSRFLSGSAERTFSLPPSSTPPGSLLLPSYPLTSVAGPLTPSLPRTQAEPSLSMSSTWPSRRDISPQRRSDITGELSSSKRSPLPPRTARVSSIRRSGRSSSERDRTLRLDLLDPEEEPLDRQEMLNSLRSLRNSAAKKRAKVSASGSEPDPDSPDSAVKLDLAPDWPDQTSISPLSESGLSSLTSPASPRDPKSSPVKPRVPQQDKGLSDASVSVVGQRLAYRPSDADEEKPSDTTSSGPTRTGGREPLRALRPAKGSPQMSEGVIGRGVFGSVVPPSRPSVASPDQGDSSAAHEPLSGVFGHAITNTHTESEGTEPDELQERVKLSKFASDKMRQGRREQQNEAHTHTPDSRRRRTTHTHADDVRDVNGYESLSDESPSSPTAPLNPVTSLSPAHQPVPPTGPPNRNAAPRVRRTSSLNRTIALDELIPGKDGQDPAELRPFSKPELALTQSFRLLASDDWEKKIEGLNFLRSLAQYHPDVLLVRIHDVCLALIQEVRNLRSGVSRVAVAALGEMFVALQKGMDQDLDGTARALLLKAGESNAFIRQDVERALDSMVKHCSLSRCLSALMAGGLGHLSGVVRRCAAQHLCVLVERAGAARLLSGAKDLTDRILPAVARLAQDSSQEARFFGRRMLLFLSSHRDFDKMMEKFVPAKDLPAIRDAVFTLKTKGLGEMPQDVPSARGRRSLVRTSSLTRDPLTSSSRDCGQCVSKASAHTHTHSLADRSEYVKQMKALLSSRDFRERMKAIDQLVCDCTESPALVIGSLFPVFDALKARLQESNSKVNLRALEALQPIVAQLKDGLAPVLNILIPAVVDNHLNSKNSSVSTAALGAVQALILNVDNSLLLQPFCAKAQYLSGKAKLDMIEKVAELVTELYPRKPQLVEQKVLPLLWKLLGSSCSSGSVRTAAAKLAEALHSHMGRALMDCASGQSAGVQSDLNQLLRTQHTHSHTHTHSLST